MNTTLVIHHSADLDGICSREIARKALGDTADYLGFDYGQPIPDLAPYETVYLIDISLPEKVMVANAAKLILIDHHKSLIASVEWFKGEFKGYYCIDGVAACRLAWQWFNSRSDHNGVDGLATKQDYIDRKVSEPYAVQLLGEFDIWDKRSDHVDLFQLGMQAWSFPDWQLLLLTDCAETSNQVAHIINDGRTIQRYTDVINAQISQERGFDVVFEGRTFRALNTARSNSLTFTAALKPHHDGCLSYFWDGTKWKFSLYGVPGKPDIDLSEIAKRYGGGGHKQACGGFFAILPRELGGQ